MLWDVIKSRCGGEGGIRTPGTHKRTIDFESITLNHSDTSPSRGLYDSEQFHLHQINHCS